MRLLIRTVLTCVQLLALLYICQGCCTPEPRHWQNFRADLCPKVVRVEVPQSQPSAGETPRRSNDRQPQGGRIVGPGGCDDMDSRAGGVAAPGGSRSLSCQSPSADGSSREACGCRMGTPVPPVPDYTPRLDAIGGQLQGIEDDVRAVKALVERPQPPAWTAGEWLMVLIAVLVAVSILRPEIERIRFRRHVREAARKG